MEDVGSLPWVFLQLELFDQVSSRNFHTFRQ